MLQVFWGFWVACRVLLPRLATGSVTCYTRAGLASLMPRRTLAVFPVDPNRFGRSVTAGQELLEAATWE